MTQRTTQIEIAMDATNNSLVSFSMVDGNLTITNACATQVKETQNKIEKELDLNLTKNPQNNRNTLLLHRKIRNKLGNSIPELSLCPEPKKTTKGYYPVIKNGLFSFEPAINAKTRAEPNIIVKNTRAGICQSDRRVMLGTKSSNFDTEEIVLGHEGGGYIVDPGLCDDLFKIGQKVVLLPHLTCWQDDCEYCSTYRQNLCPKMKHMGFHIQGNFASVMAYPEQCVMGVPDELNEDMLPLIEPLACVSRGIFHLKDHLRKLNNISDSKDSTHRITIYGGGPIGCIAAICCRIFFKNVFIEIIDPIEQRLKVTKHFNLADSYATKPTSKHDIAFIANSFFNSIETALDYSINAGKILLFSGINTNEFEQETDLQHNYIKMFERIHRQETREPLQLDEKEILLIGSSGYNYYDIQRAINLLMKHNKIFNCIQNAVIDGLDSTQIEYTAPNKKTTQLANNALLSFLTPEGVFDKMYGKEVALSIKTLIRIK